MENKVYILDTDILNDDYIYNKLYSALSSYRQEKIERFRFRKDKNLSLGAGVLIDVMLREFNLFEKNMTYSLGENEKPTFSEYKDIHFNVSHSNNKVICAVSSKEVGCDIEKISPIDINIAKKFFLNSEYEYIKKSKNQEDAFYLLWTLKESFMKITGLGMSLPLNSFEISITDDDITVSQNLNNSNYYFHEYECVDGYKISVCSHLNTFHNELINVNEKLSNYY
ncbi:MAG: 4'-phosphopantetheinyl transferase superfamily protein [Clostridium sp.]|nr:4'-phosphopantetheinyl transferase superfamily protein [Clostridium sp.]